MKLPSLKGAAMFAAGVVVSVLAYRWVASKVSQLPPI